MDNIFEELKKISKITIDDSNIRHYVSLMEYYNKLNSNYESGKEIYEGYLELPLSRRNYYESDIDFIIGLFIRQNTLHLFPDGNKRTNCKIYTMFIENYTPFQVSSIAKLEKMQNKFVNNEISEVEFQKNLRLNLQIRNVKKDDKVKLEGHILRADIVGSSVTNTDDSKSTISLRDLMMSDDNVFFETLRKPYFQRDTNEWSVERIERIISAFLNNMLIPSVILWNSSEGVFIVDGAHRISALAAWVNDDYGKTYDILFHYRVKNYIDKKIGSYKSKIKGNDMKVKTLLGRKALKVDWISGTYDIVKESFININMQGKPITKQEIEMIQNDNTPVSLLSRAIISNIGGQVSKLDDDRIPKIVSLMFNPDFDPTHHLYSICGDKNSGKLIERVFPIIKLIDADENLSIYSLIKRVYSIFEYISCELELSNKVYFYNSRNTIKIASLHGIIVFIRNLQDNDKIQEFLDVRGKFEDYLLENGHHLQNLVRNGRQVSKSIGQVSRYFSDLLEHLLNDEVDKFEKKYSSVASKTVTDRSKDIHDRYLSEVGELERCSKCNGYINANSGRSIHKICE